MTKTTKIKLSIDVPDKVLEQIEELVSSIGMKNVNQFAFQSLMETFIRYKENLKVIDEAFDKQGYIG